MDRQHRLGIQNHVQSSADVLKEAKQFLVCDGLDTLAEVSLNGKLLGKTDNMYRQWKWDVTGSLKETNEISIIFRGPVAYVTAKQKEKYLRNPGESIPGGGHLRKAPCHFGWDWGPMLPPIGVWKDIRIEGHSTAKFEDVHVRQKHEGGKVTVNVNAKVEALESRTSFIDNDSDCSKWDGTNVKSGRG